VDGIVVSVGLCVRNCEESISQTLDSIIAQDYPRALIEVVVVDDGCVDNTIPIVMKKLSEAGMSFTVLKSGGRGLGVSRQKVVDNSRGKYVVWIDGDMTVPHDYVSKQVEFMESHPHSGRARANWGWVRTGKIVGDLQFLAYADEVRTGKQSSISGTGGSIFRLEAIRSAGGFDAQIRGSAEDVDLAMRMLAQGWGFSVSTTVFHHRPKTSWSGLWGQYRWYGYGAHYLSHKYSMRRMEIVRSPPLAFAIGIKKAVAAFRLTRMKRSFLLPVSFVFSSLAWWAGFASAHMERYEPHTKC
jgi:glycosyltransferase involved in cell wall biosynthesis